VYAASFAVSLDCGAAWAQNSLSNDPFGLQTPRVVPQAKSKQSPDATACATGGGRVAPDARIAACSRLIESGKWKGKDIGWAYANRCAVYSAQGKADKAFADCEKAIEVDPDSVIGYQIRGDILLQRGESEKALADYDNAIAHGARYAAIFVDRGNLLLAKGESQKAIADFDQALAFNPNSARALIARGGARFTGGEFDAAVADFDKAIEYAPESALAWQNRGSAHFAQGDFAKAAENFHQALKLDPANAYVALWLFIAGKSGAGSADAKADLRAHAGKLPKAWPWPVVQLYLGDKDATQTLAAATTPAEQCEAQFYVGEALTLEKAVDAALPLLRKAAEICPKDFTESVQAQVELKKLETPTLRPTTEAQPESAPAPKAEPAPEPAPVAAPAAEPAPTPVGQSEPAKEPEKK
jgi:tetratricopeptide (TPR) repeat protein